MIRTESYKKGMLYSVIFNFLAKGILFFLTVLIGRYFGTGLETDIYFFIYGTMILLSAFTSTVDTAVLIPHAMQLRQKEGEVASMSFLNYFTRIYFMIGVAFVGLVLIMGVMIFSVFSKFQEADIILYRQYFIAGSFYFLLMILTNFFTAIFTSYKYFTVPMLVSGINSVLIILSIWLLHNRFHVMSVLYGGIVAYSVNLIILIAMMKRLLNWKFFNQASKPSSREWKNILNAGIGQGATVISNYFPLYLLSGLGEGVISLMNYGKNIADIPNTLITSQIANVAGIRMNEDSGKEDWQNMNKKFVADSSMLAYILAPISCLLILFPEFLLKLLYNNSSMDGSAISEAAKFLSIFAMSIIPIGINAMAARVFFSLKIIRPMLIYQLLINLILITAIWLLMSAQGKFGFPLAVAVVQYLNILSLYFVFKKLAPFINYGKVLLNTALAIVISGILSIAYYLVFK